MLESATAQTSVQKELIVCKNSVVADEMMDRYYYEYQASISCET